MPIWGKAGYSPGYITCRMKVPLDEDAAAKIVNPNPDDGRAVQWGTTMPRDTIPAKFCGRESTKLIAYRIVAHDPGGNTGRELFMFACDEHLMQFKMLGGGRRGRDRDAIARRPPTGDLRGSQLVNRLIQTGKREW